MIMPFHRSSLIALVATLTLAACGGDGGVDITEITSVSVAPGTTTLVSLGATQQLTASASAADTSVPDVTFTWSSSDASVASVIGGTASGRATITVVDAGGSNLSVPNLTWSSSDPTITTVDDTGLVTGVAESQVVVTASQDGASGTVGAGVL